MVSLTSIIGRNEDLLPVIMNVYAKDGDKIADVTYGNGNFWKNIDMTKYQFFPSDLKTGVDFRNLPYETESFDMIVLDPPYLHRSSSPINKDLDSTYGNNKRDGFGTEYVYGLYQKGIEQAYRVLKVNGLLLVKCQDQIMSGINRWDHIVIFHKALNFGFMAEDLFIITRVGTPIMRHKYQLHARKNHSYMWVFKKK